MWPSGFLSGKMCSRTMDGQLAALKKRYKKSQQKETSKSVFPAKETGMRLEKDRWTRSKTSRRNLSRRPATVSPGSSSRRPQSGHGPSRHRTRALALPPPRGPLPQLRRRHAPGAARPEDLVEKPPGADGSGHRIQTISRQIVFKYTFRIGKTPEVPLGLVGRGALNRFFFWCFAVQTGRSSVQERQHSVL